MTVIRVNMLALIFSLQEDKLFIEPVRKYSMLYDSSHVQYKYIIIIEDSIWNEIFKNISNWINDNQKSNCSRIIQKNSQI